MQRKLNVSEAAVHRREDYTARTPSHGALGGQHVTPVRPSRSARAKWHSTKGGEKARTDLLLSGMVRTAHQWPRFHMPEARGQTFLAQSLEFLGGIDA